MSWVVQIYEMTGLDGQQRALNLLRDLDDTIAEAADNGVDHYLIIECNDADHARSKFSLITSADPGATLIHATAGRVDDFQAADLAPSTGPQPDRVDL